jgi:peptidoglycan/xylan/chitin deacetylase (PgdA/CDA1 family)
VTDDSMDLPCIELSRNGLERSPPNIEDKSEETSMNCRVPILLYHSVADEGPPELAPYRVSCTAFQQQMQFLRERGYYGISLAEWRSCIEVRRPLEGRPVIITFDDGYRDFAETAWPIMAEANLRATVFVVTGRVGSVANWDQVSGEPLPLMNWHQLRAMQQHGNAIGSHCAAHRGLTELSDEAIAADSIEARAALRRELGQEVTAIAYPWGQTNPRIRRILAENGYRTGVSIMDGLSTFADDVMLLPRIEIFDDDDLDSFALKIDADNHENRTAGGAIVAAV